MLSDKTKLFSYVTLPLVVENLILSGILLHNYLKTKRRLRRDADGYNESGFKDRIWSYEKH